MCSSSTAGPEAGEIKNMAVEPAYRGRGIGRALIAAAVDRTRERRSTLAVATAAADVGNLRFYQRTGLPPALGRAGRVLAGDGLPGAGTTIDGIPLRDRVWLDRRLDEP